jgi:hypothetical protein
MIDAEQIAPHADRPGNRRTLNFQYAFDFIEQFDRRPAVPIQLVDEGHDGCVAKPADVHELDGALFDTLGAVDDHQGRIDRRQRAVGVFGEVLMARRVEQIDDAIFVGKLHHGRRHGNAALLFQAHPVGGRVARGLAALHGARHLNGAAEQQELLGQGGLARVGVGNDGKSSSLADFLG